MRQSVSPDKPKPSRPPWLKIKVQAPRVLAEVERLMRTQRLTTVCEEAHCPNQSECWGVHRTATFLLMGATCTRRCAFCQISKGKPSVLDPAEPQRVAEAVATLGLDFAVLTSVTRDDVPDGGAAHFAQAIGWIRTLSPGCGVEVLIPDFQGQEAALRTVLEAHPEVLNYNVETVPRLYATVRPQATYDRSLELLSRASRWRTSHAPDLAVKSGLMLGLGEDVEEVREVMRDWRRAGVDIVTLGQYLPPTPRHLPLVEYVPPERFELYRREGEAMGFRRVESGPLVRSSYHARTSWRG